MLLFEEQNIRGKYGWSCLVYLLCYGDTSDFDFNCKRFKELLINQKDLIDNDGETLLMRLCKLNPILLEH